MIATGADWRTGDLRTRWEAVLRRLHSENLYAPGRDDYYGWEVVEVGDDGADLVIHAFFLSGHRYCCCEPGCHFVLGRAWPRIRRAMAEECIDHLNPVRILEWRVTVEAGSVFHAGSVDAPGRTTTAAFSYREGPFCEPDEE